MPGTHGFDRKAAGVQDQGVVGLVQAFQVQPGLTHEHLAFEVDREVQVDMCCAVVIRVRERVVIDA